MNYNSEHSLNDFLKNENIKPDRFGMAAISYIFKAFGDVIRSKEYWPWGETVNFSWDNGKDNISDDQMQEALDISNWNSNGNLGDLTRAMLCLKEAQVRSKEDSSIKIKQKNRNDIKALKKRLDQIALSTKRSNTISTNINATSELAEEEKTAITGNNQ